MSNQEQRKFIAFVNVSNVSKHVESPWQSEVFKWDELFGAAATR